MDPRSSITVVRIQDRQFLIPTELLRKYCPTLKPKLPQGKATITHVNLVGIEEATFETITQYFRTGQLPGLTVQNVIDVYCASSDLGIKPLETKCWSHIFNDISSEDQSLILYAEMEKSRVSKTEKHAILDHLEKKFTRVVNSNGFLQLTELQLRHLISYAPLRSKFGIDMVYRAAMRWLHADCRARQQYAEKVMSSVGTNYEPSTCADVSVCPTIAKDVPALSKSEMMKQEKMKLDTTITEPSTKKVKSPKQEAKVKTDSIPGPGPGKSETGSEKRKHHKKTKRSDKARKEKDSTEASSVSLTSDATKEKKDKAKKKKSGKSSKLSKKSKKAKNDKDSDSKSKKVSKKSKKAKKEKSSGVSSKEQKKGHRSKSPRKDKSSRKSRKTDKSKKSKKEKKKSKKSRKGSKKSSKGSKKSDKAGQSSKKQRKEGMSSKKSKKGKKSSKPSKRGDKGSKSDNSSKKSKKVGKHSKKSKKAKDSSLKTSPKKSATIEPKGILVDSAKKSLDRIYAKKASACEGGNVNKLSPIIEQKEGSSSEANLKKHNHTAAPAAKVTLAVEETKKVLTKVSPKRIDGESKKYSPPKSLETSKKAKREPKVYSNKAIKDMDKASKEYKEKSQKKIKSANTSGKSKSSKKSKEGRKGKSASIKEGKKSKRTTAKDTGDSKKDNSTKSKRSKKHKSSKSAKKSKKSKKANKGDDKKAAPILKTK